MNKKIPFIVLLQLAYILLIYVALAFGNATFNLKEMNAEFRGFAGFLIIVGCVFIPVFVNILDEN